MKTKPLVPASCGRKVACACALLLLAAKFQVSAQTIQAGIQSAISAGSNTETSASTISSAYVTAVLGGNAYLQDSSGGIYFYKGGTGTGDFGLTSANLGGMLTAVTGNGFVYFTGGTTPSTQFEYEPAAGGTTNTATAASMTTGTYANIPASFYTLQTTAQVNSAASQGSATAQGIQNQLVTLKNVTITPTGTASATTFTSGGTYTMTDTAGTATLFVNAASGIVGQAVPTGATNVSGVFQDYKGTSEIIPTGTYDFYTGASNFPLVPEPSSYVLLGCAGLVLILFARRQRVPKLN